ncbi:MAG TPA: hypothetical protein DDW52_14965 [Planctomycetaceae bacterium]|nr:hypothetical protein [Planctomycetaceae bacterium]
MSADLTPKLPTDSLYKMLTIGGIVLVVSGVLLLMQSNAALQQLRNERLLANATYVQSGARLRVAFETLVGRIRELEQRAEQIDEDFKVSTSFAIEVTADGKLEPKSVHDEFSYESWITTLDWTSRYIDGLGRWAEEHEVGEEVGNEVASLGASTAELYAMADAVRLPEQKRTAAEVQYESFVADWLFTHTLVVALLLFGLYVFVRASLNWYNQSQRFQDAILARQIVDDTPLPGEASLIGELRNVFLVFSACVFLFNPIENSFRFLLAFFTVGLLVVVFAFVDARWGVQTIATRVWRKLR